MPVHTVASQPKWLRDVFDDCISSFLPTSCQLGWVEFLGIFPFHSSLSSMHWNRRKSRCMNQSIFASGFKSSFIDIDLMTTRIEIGFDHFMGWAQNHITKTKRINSVFFCTTFFFFFNSSSRTSAGTWKTRYNSCWRQIYPPKVGLKVRLWSTLASK